MIKITPPLFFLYSAATDAALNRNSKVAFAEIEHQTKTETELFAS